MNETYEEGAIASVFILSDAKIRFQVAIEKASKETGSRTRLCAFLRRALREADALFLRLVIGVGIDWP